MAERSDQMQLLGPAFYLVKVYCIRENYLSCVNLHIGFPAVFPWPNRDGYLRGCEIITPYTAACRRFITQTTHPDPHLLLRHASLVGISQPRIILN